MLNATAVQQVGPEEISRNSLSSRYFTENMMVSATEQQPRNFQRPDFMRISAASQNEEDMSMYPWLKQESDHHRSQENCFCSTT